MSKVSINGLTVEQRNGRTFVNGKDITDIVPEAKSRSEFCFGLLCGIAIPILCYVIAYAMVGGITT